MERIPALAALCCVLAGCSAPQAFPEFEFCEPETEFGAVKLKWRYCGNPEGMREKEVRHFLLERRREGVRWAPIAEVEGSARSYVDGDVEPKVAYEYRITPVGAERGAGSHPVVVVTPGRFSLRVLGVAGRILSPDGPKVLFEITKQEPGLGAFTGCFVHKAGDRIGVNATTERSEYWMRKEGVEEKIRVDFDTGWTLVGVENTVLKLPDAGSTTTRRFRTTEIRYEDEEKEASRVFYPEVPPPEGWTEVLRLPTPPPFSSEAEKKYEHDEKAMEILRNADRAWEQKKADKAVRLYRTLMKDFRETSVFERNRRRIVGRGEQEDWPE